MIVACRQPLARILATCPGVDEIVVEGSRLPEFEVYAPIMSLPRILGTSFSTVPAEVPYLTADAALVEHWREALGPRGQFTVGIAWQGNPQHRTDHHRSFPLAQFEPLARVDGVRLFSLQKGFGAEQIGEVRRPFRGA